jgi:uncharacterized protein YndB with AHSA1/START domain
MTEHRPKPFRVELTVAAPREEVWRALTTPEVAGEWFGYDYDGLDAEITAIFVDDGTAEPPDRLVFSDGSYLEAAPDGPRTVVRAVLPGPLGDGWDDIYDPIAQGWRTYLEQLRFLLETRPAGRRRTVYLTGEATGAEVLAAAGAGRPWFDGRRERIVVDADGHLVAAAADHPFDSRATGPVNILVTTYGLDDAAFAALRAEWTSRWQAVAGNAAVTC